MNYFASPSFWKAYNSLPKKVQLTAIKSYNILKNNPSHRSLHFKKIGRYWSARVGIHYRALAVEVDDGILWLWIGSHTEYDKLIQK